MPCTLRPSFGTNIMKPLLRVSPLLWTAVCTAQMDTQTFQKAYAEAVAKTRAGTWSAAMGLWHVLTAQNPYNGSLANNLATSLFQSKDYRAAASAYERAFELGFGSPADSVYMEASCLALLGDREAALKQLERAFDLGYTRPERAF